jgi:hypothetical protein
MVHRTVLAIKSPRLTTVHLLLFWAANIAIVIIASGRLAGKGSQTTAVLDLTAEVPRDEQGYYHGIPGSSGGGATGGWRAGPGDTVPYRLPLSLEILHATPNKDGNFVFEVLLRNTTSAPFDLPSSLNLATIEKPGNKSRRVFFLQLQPLGTSKPGILALGFAATGGSTSVPGSFTRLEPGNPQESEKLAVKVICNEWRLDDNKYFLSGMSDDLASANTIQFALRGDQVAPVQP